MQTILKIFIFSNIIYISSCNKTNCEDLQLTFSSYDEATNAIRISSNKVKKSIISLKSSWINGAEYYSCDGIIGFFILKTNKQLTLGSLKDIQKSLDLTFQR